MKTTNGDGLTEPILNWTAELHSWVLQDCFGSDGILSRLFCGRL